MKNRPLAIRRDTGDGRNNGAETLRLTAPIAWMAVIFAISARPSVPQLPGFMSSMTAVLGHLAVYAILAALLYWAVESLALSGARRLFIAFAVAVCYGISDEWHQSFVPGRDPSMLDVGVDAVGALAALAIISLLTISRADRCMPER
jgi:VanZ family protein